MTGACVKIKLFESNMLLNSFKTIYPVCLRQFMFVGFLKQSCLNNSCLIIDNENLFVNFRLLILNGAGYLKI